MQWSCQYKYNKINTLSIVFKIQTFQITVVPSVIVTHRQWIIFIKPIFMIYSLMMTQLNTQARTNQPQNYQSKHIIRLKLISSVEVYYSQQLQKLMNCIVCRGSKKYKCSKCRSPYCSAKCYQVHKEECSGEPKIIPQIPYVDDNYEAIIKTDYLSDEQLRIPLQKLQLLSKDQKLKQILTNPILRRKLIEIDNSKQRMTAVQQAMQEDHFYNFFKQVIQTLQLKDQQ